ncbi:hypothetical protein HanIR_Chr12g0584651 [Helianthus annuus]|nr:hypothetical protein HanIR_Chr12g0584651 [Helianthus annuus]
MKLKSDDGGGAYLVGRESRGRRESGQVLLSVVNVKCLPMMLIYNPFILIVQEIMCL